jgi:hypothetical protein
MGFFSFETAERTLKGYEIMSMIRKGQVNDVAKGDIKGQVTFIASLFRVVASMKQVARPHAPPGFPQFLATQPAYLARP